MAPLRGYLSRVLREVRDHVVIFSERVHDGRKNKGVGKEKTKELGESQGSIVSCKPRKEAFVTRKKKWSTA